jgi:hypothetical protein
VAKPSCGADAYIDDNGQSRLTCAEQKAPRLPRADSVFHYSAHLHALLVHTGWFGHLRRCQSPQLSPWILPPRRKVPLLVPRRLLRRLEQEPVHCLQYR